MFSKYSNQPMYTTIFNIDAYLSEYLYGKWGIALQESNDKKMVVKIPKDVYLSNLLHSLTIRKPKHLPEAWGNVEIVLPFIKEGAKRPDRHNFISVPSANLFNKRVRQFFRAELHEYIDNQKHIFGISIKDACMMFVMQFGIESIDPDSLAKNYYRWKGTIREVNKTSRAFTSR